MTDDLYQSCDIFLTAFISILYLFYRVSLKVAFFGWMDFKESMGGFVALGR